MAEVSYVVHSPPTANGTNSTQRIIAEGKGEGVGDREASLFKEDRGEADESGATLQRYIELQIKARGAKEEKALTIV